jgi:energy-coupling factor transport system substrate-specific component
MNRTLTGLLLAVSALIGLVALLYPLLAPILSNAVDNGENFVNQPGSSSYALMTTLLIGISLVALLLEIQGQTANAKIIAALGVLVAITSVLRLIETAIPGLGGFSPIFVPIILAGYVFGSRFGFLMGTLSILTSALITAGVGPWLPFQMFVAGWVGVTAGLLPHPESDSREIILLAGFSFIWGLLYGAILNLYFWPFLAGDALHGSQAADNLTKTLAGYGAFYMTTSFLWDLARSIGNFVLIVAVGVPMIRALTRFRDRFQFEIA